MATEAAAVDQFLLPVAGLAAVATVATVALGAYFLRTRPRGAHPNPGVYGVATLATVAGLLVALVGEGLGGTLVFVLVGGTVSLAGVAVLTATVAALPAPAGEEADAGH